MSEEYILDPKLTKRLVSNIDKSAQEMDRRVAELLDLAKLQIGELGIKSELFNIQQSITSIVSQLIVLFDDKEQVLKVNVPYSLPKINGDKGKLEQVIFNLLSNANKFSPVKSEITLKGREADKRIIVEIEDSAQAVTEEEKKRMFEPYYRSDDAEKRERYPGLGLGLSISKKIVELHQGDIWVKGSPGKGNTFGFSLPVDLENKRI